MGNVIQDLRFALRQLIKAPSFAITAALTLALGIGANTAIFSLINMLILKPLPVPRAEQILTLAPREGKGPLQPAFSWNEYKEIRDQTSHSVSAVFAYSTTLDGLAVRGQQPDRVMTSYVSGNFFEALELKPAAGRLILPGEGEIVNHDPVIVLDYRYWTQKFKADPDAVGRTIAVNGHPFTIVGVAPRTFKGMQGFVTMAAYIPLSELPNSGTSEVALNNWQNRIFFVNARLRPGATLKQADAELSLVAQNLVRLHPNFEKKLSIEAYPEPQLRINPGDPRVIPIMAGLFLSLALVVVLLACVNVANLVLVRATVREREMAVRIALGARRSRLIIQMTTEGVLLALIGGGLGVLVGMWAGKELTHVNLNAPIPIALSVDFDWRIFLYSLSIALVAGVIVGMVPALRINRSTVNTILHDGGRSVSGGRHWLRDSLVVMQIAGSLVLLVVTSLFVRSLYAMQTRDFGFNPDHVMNFTLDSNEIGMNDAASRDLATKITARLHQIAGVEAVSHASSTPMGYINNSDRMIVDGIPPPANPSDRNAFYTIVSPEYFNVMRIALESGRTFTNADDEHNMDVAIISESAARKLRLDQDPIGRTFRLASEKDRKLTIVGVARDTEFQLFNGGRSAPFFYIPYAQHSNGSTLMVFQARTQGDPATIAPAVEKAIHEIAPQLPIFSVQTMREALYTMTGLLLFQIGATLAAILGGLGFTLAVIGLYGVVSYTAGRRVQEIGLRMALGASRATVFRMIYRQSIIIIAVGLGFGLVMAFLAAQTVRSFVVVSVYQPATYAVVAAVLAGAALAACYFPARRAMAVEPTVALRES